MTNWFRINIKIKSFICNNVAKGIAFVGIILISLSAMAQNKELQKALDQFANDPALLGASIGISVAELPSKNEIAGFDSNRFLAPASTQKAVLCATALEVFGSAYRFQHSLIASVPAVDGVIKGDLILDTGGDPSFGAERFKDNDPIKKIVEALQSQGIKTINGTLYIQDDLFDGNVVAASTAWGDVGNYFGAGAPSFSFHENLYELYFNPSTGGQVDVMKTDPILPGCSFVSTVEATNTRSDNAWIYTTPGSNIIRVQGEIPKTKDPFMIKGSIPDPTQTFYNELDKALRDAGISLGKWATTSLEGSPVFADSFEIWKGSSPSMKEIVKQTNIHSINTYADVLLKHIGLKLQGAGSFQSGERAIKDFWKERGVPIDGLNLEDGSGLSRGNAISARQMSLIIAKLKPVNQKIFKESLKPFGPNELVKRQVRAKSGYISGVRGYTGYITAASGAEYTFAILVNNAPASSSVMKGKIEKLAGEILEALN